ncbi:COMM domain-containing protein 8 isoform X2 [Corythoichthys intestinalis]|uniref:COMM domain-containing protein 8 isoform X2 n=1 Tax=Corythoichthys intestinalis TaxID=161448 RepID=UPI0025A54272|nr:COMM domain-containing protein 8 isoform X2 [Corythoichthys intestinalis]
MEKCRENLPVRYRDKLVTTAKDRYVSNFKDVNNVDPHEQAEHKWNKDVDKLPPLREMDIMLYLVFGVCYYTHQQFRNYKSLQSYEQFCCGWVQDLHIMTIANGNTIFLAKLCHRIVDGICGREPPRRGDYSTTWNLEEWLELINSLAALFRLSVGNNSSDEEVLVSLSDMSSSHSEAVLNVLKARREEIHNALLARTTSISSAILQDFDWQLKMALSSDKISSLQTPLLNLNLDVKENGTLKSIIMEMNREELNTLIISLEAANKVD